MDGKREVGAVALAAQRPASEILHSVLVDAVTATGGDPAAFGMPATAETFRRSYPRVLPGFEAARLASPARNAIAEQAITGLAEALVWSEGGNEVPLAMALARAVSPLHCDVHELGGPAGWHPDVTYGGRRWSAAALPSLAELLVARNVITREAGDALAWLHDNVLDGDVLSLAGRRIAVLGAGAEMAPTRAWLKAGADVLWLDTVPPPASWLTDGTLAGRLHVPVTSVDLLSRPQEVLATLLAFSATTPVDLGLYAYAPGQARELRLTGVMNAIVNALPVERVRSVTLLVSPTTPTALSPADVAAMQTRRHTRPAWEALLARAGLLDDTEGCARCAEVAVTRTVVGIQGASYQAAQYVGKVLTAAGWASAAPAFRVSANTAAITRTRSLEHPVFAAAFRGATAFGVETLEPEQSRCLNGLLAVHDWLRPEAPVPGAIRVHGGIHTLPYPLESALRVAATLGFMRSPRLLGGLFRR
ncbi:MAG: hypothetical protein R3E84_04840 [Pseudomonadales bacterium]